jgi:hypothetical protein
MKANAGERMTAFLYVREKVTAHLPISPITIQTSNALRRCLLARVKVLAVRFTVIRCQCRRAGRVRVLGGSAYFSNLVAVGPVQSCAPDLPASSAPLSAMVRAAVRREKSCHLSRRMQLHRASLQAKTFRRNEGSRSLASYSIAFVSIDKES